MHGGHASVYDSRARLQELFAFSHYQAEIKDPSLLSLFLFSLFLSPTFLSSLYLSMFLPNFSFISQETASHVVLCNLRDRNPETVISLYSIIIRGLYTQHKHWYKPPRKLSQILFQLCPLLKPVRNLACCLLILGVTLVSKVRKLTTTMTIKNKLSRDYRKYYGNAIIINYIGDLIK